MNLLSGRLEFGSNNIFLGVVFQLKWSPSEKRAARAAFDLAQDRELKAIRQETEALLQKSVGESSIWRVHEYLSESRLVAEGLWLSVGSRSSIVPLA